MRLRVLGCSPGMGTGAGTTAFLLDQDTLIDAGSGVSSLDSASLQAVRRVFLTHAHLDHCGFLPFVAGAASERTGGTLEVYGRIEVLEALSAHLFNGRLWPDLRKLPSSDRPLVRLVPVRPAVPVIWESRLAVLFETRHTVPAGGWWIEGEGRAFAFTGDTASCPAIWTALNGLPRLDVLIVEVSFPDEQAGLAELGGHLTPATLAADLRGLRHPAKILLTHLAPGNEIRILDQCRAALAPRPVDLLQPGTLEFL